MSSVDRSVAPNAARWWAVVDSAVVPMVMAYAWKMLREVFWFINYRPNKIECYYVT